MCACHSTIVPPFISPAAGGREREGDSCSEGTFAVGVNQEPRKDLPQRLPLRLGKCLVCFGHRCNLSNKHFIPSASCLAEVVPLNDAFLRGHERGKCSVRLESFNLNQPPPTHYWHIKGTNEAYLITRAPSLQLVCRQWFFFLWFFFFPLLTQQGKIWSCRRSQ